MINLTDLTTRFGEQEIAELSDKEHYRTLNIDVVNKAILDAESEAESYLAAVGVVSRHANGELVYRYGDMPMPLMIRLCDMARYYLYEDGVTEIVEKRYQQAVEWLKQVMKNPSMLTGIETAKICVMPNPKPDVWSE